MLAGSGTGTDPGPGVGVAERPAMRSNLAVVCTVSVNVVVRMVWMSVLVFVFRSLVPRATKNGVPVWHPDGG